MAFRLLNGAWTLTGDNRTCGSWRGVPQYGASGAMGSRVHLNTFRAVSCLSDTTNTSRYLVGAGQLI